MKFIMLLACQSLRTLRGLVEGLTSQKSEVRFRAYDISN